MELRDEPGTWSGWTLMAAGIVTAAIFLMGYGVGLHLGRAAGWPGMPALLEHAAGIGLISVASSIYYTLGPDSGDETTARAVGVRVALILAAFLAAGAGTGFMAVRLLGPVPGV